MSQMENLTTTGQYATVKAKFGVDDVFIQIGNADLQTSTLHGQYFDVQDLKEFRKFLKKLQRKLERKEGATA